MNASLPPPDSHRLAAAQGWLGLGLAGEAEAELATITPQFRSHPDVLRSRLEVCAAAGQWQAVLELSATLIQLEPAKPFGWLQRSYALHELERTVEARENLLQVVDKFPLSSTIRYNLACYECRLGRLDKAKAWLETVFKLGNPKQVKLEALNDRDLAPLWKEIKSA